MPHGNHHSVPHGIWFFEPTTRSVGKLVLKSCRNVALSFLALTAFYEYRSLAWKYTYNNFVGRSMIYGAHTTNTHEPASMEYIDQLKAEMAERRRLSRQK